jgi:hypothetical protein
VFFLGAVFAFQGFVGKKINPEGRPLAMPIDLDRPGISRTPDGLPKSAASSADFGETLRELGGPRGSRLGE